MITDVLKYFLQLLYSLYHPIFTARLLFALSTTSSIFFALPRYLFLPYRY